MQLRRLEKKDAPLMLEWMNDPEVVKDMQANFMDKTIKDCEKFIEYAQDSGNDMHLAIVDDNDEYFGTVSLKHITKKNAEFAIIVRKSAMGKGYSKYGMTEMIRIGLEELKLDEVYWCVNPVNKRAVRFYDKNQYQRVAFYDSNFYENVEAQGSYTEEQLKSYIWYVVNDTNNKPL